MEPRAKRYVAVVGLAGVALTLLAAARLPIEVADPALVAVLSLLAVAAGLVPVRFLRGQGVQGFTLEGGVFVALLFVAPLGLIPAVLVAASLLTHGLRSGDVTKTLFNAARIGLETTAGVAVFALLGPDAPLPTDPAALMAAIAASITLEVVSIAAMTELFHRLSGSARAAALRDVTGISLITFAGNTSYGIVLAAVAVVSPWITALTGLLMVGLYFGFRGVATAVGDRRRAESINEITHLLLDMTSLDDTVGALIPRLVSVFGGDGGRIVVQTPDGIRSWQDGAGGMAMASLDELPRSGVLGRAIGRNRGIVDVDDDLVDSPDAIAAPIGRAGHPEGAVAVWGRHGLEPWDAADASLLAAIANEIGVAVENHGLFRQVEDERARLESESARLADILGAAGDGIALIEADGRIDAWNPGFARITGVDAEVAIGQAWHAVLRLKGEDGVELAPAGDHVFRRALAGQRLEGAQPLQAMRADGVWRLLSCTASPVVGTDGRTHGMVLVARDVTAERELDKLKSDFISTVSHELRTPLTPLKGFLATLQNPAARLNEAQLDTVHRSMASQVTRLETLISDLLAVAELDHGRFDLRPEPVDASDIVRDAVAVEAGDAADRCLVQVDTSSAVMADRVALVRIVRSLVGNALKHTEGAVLVRVFEARDRVNIAVADEGPGIPAWDQERIWGRFSRLGDHLRRTQGPGLGLTIARTLATRMDGSISLTSDIRQGSVFTLQLPRATPRLVHLDVAVDG